VNALVNMHLKLASGHCARW